MICIIIAVWFLSKRKRIKKKKLIFHINRVNSTMSSRMFILYVLTNSQPSKVHLKTSLTVKVYCIAAFLRYLFFIYFECPSQWTFNCDDKPIKARRGRMKSVLSVRALLVVKILLLLVLSPNTRQQINNRCHFFAFRKYKIDLYIYIL